MRPPTRRLLSLHILALWMAPSAGALGVGLHVVLDHHGHPETEHPLGLSELARAAVHGHHHDAEPAPEHRHETIVDGASPVLRTSLSPIAILPAPGSPGTAPTDPSSLDRPSKRGPPTPLFTACCSLLL